MEIIGFHDQMAYPETMDSMAHDPKQAYQTRSQEVPVCHLIGSIKKI